MRCPEAMLTRIILLACLVAFEAIADTPTRGPQSFFEEFNGTRSDALAQWNTSFRQWGGLRTLADNRELQLYVDPGFHGSADTALGLDPFSVRDGILAITADIAPPALAAKIGGFRYTSGVLTSNHTQRYGYFEMRARMPTGPGLWPAFWLVGVGDWGNLEIDVVEILGHAPHEIHQTAHFANSKKSTVWRETDTSDGFHVFAVDWTRERISWYVDGEETFSLPNRIHVPMYLLVNLAVGGDWPGDPEPDTRFPARLEIDYIRTYAK